MYHCISTKNITLQLFMTHQPTKEFSGTLFASTIDQSKNFILLYMPVYKMMWNQPMIDFKHIFIAQVNLVLRRLIYNEKSILVKKLVTITSTTLNFIARKKYGRRKIIVHNPGCKAFKHSWNCNTRCACV